MGYFAYGWPKRYRLPSQAKLTSLEPESADTVHAIVPDPTDVYVLTVSNRALHVWSARPHRALLGLFAVGPRAIAKEGPLVGAAWAPDGTSVVAAFRNGLVLLLELLEVPSMRDSTVADDGALSFDIRQSQSQSEVLTPFETIYPIILRRIAQARVAHSPAVLTALAPCLVGAIIGTSAGHLTCFSWDAEVLWRVHVPQLLRNDNALIKMGVLCGASDANTSGPVADVLSAVGEDSSGGVAAIAYDSFLDYCGLVMGSGIALLMSLRDGGIHNPNAVEGRWLRDDGAASITIEPRRMLATVGLVDGDVEQLYIGVPAGDLCPVMRCLSLSSWYFEPTDVGAANVVSWTRDGCALVVGWEKRGLAVWSVSGCRLMWTLPQVGGILPSTPGVHAESSVANAGLHPMEQGVLSAAWGPEGLFLWAVPRHTSESPQAILDSQFIEFTFFKSTTGTSSCQSESTRLALLGADRILLLAHSAGSSSRAVRELDSTRSALHTEPELDARLAQDTASSLDEEVAWQHILIPHDYLWRNWPPDRIAVNDDASYIAVAGKFGVGIYVVRSQRWRIFGDISHDNRRIECCVLAWVGSSIVIGNERRSTSQDAQSVYELLVFPRDHVESSAVQSRCQLLSKPLLIDVRADGYLLVICEDSSVVLYSVIGHHGTARRVDLAEIYRVFLPTRTPGSTMGLSTSAASFSSKSFFNPELRSSRSSPTLRSTRQLGASGSSESSGGPARRPRLPSPGGGICIARIFPPLDHAGQGFGPNGKDAPVPTQIMLLRSTGSLVLLDVKHMMSVPLLRYVEHFWYTPALAVPFEPISHRPVWWAYGDDGTHVCFRDGMRRFLTSASGRLPESGPLAYDRPDVTEAERLASMSPMNLTQRARHGEAGPTVTSQSGGITVEQWFEVDPEVYPIGLSTRNGMVLGATQGFMASPMASDGLSMPCHIIQVKRQPVLHRLLRHLLIKPVSDDRVALQVALRCISQPQFVDSLEWLLYEAVMAYDEEESNPATQLFTEGRVLQKAALKRGVLHGRAMGSSDNIKHGSPRQSAVICAENSSAPNSGGSALFPRVIRLLKYFGEYEDVVVRCARKMDSKRWPLLFSQAGEPTVLLEQCFVSGRLRTAACLLVILQEMWGFVSSTSHSLRLVSAALARGEIGLAGDLVNFLGKAARAGMLNAEQLQSSEDVSWIAAACGNTHRSAMNGSSGLGRDNSATSMRIPSVDLAVLKHAKSLLDDMELRKLAALSVRMDFPLAAWLKREISVRGKPSPAIPFVRNFGETLIAVHRQFQYPAPSVESVLQAVRVSGTNRAHGMVSESGLLEVSRIGSSLPQSPGEVVNTGVHDAVVSKEVASKPSRLSVGVGEGGFTGEASGNGISPLSAMSPRMFAATAHEAMVGKDGETVFGSTLPPPPSSSYESARVRGMRAKARQLCEVELRYLLRVGRAAEADDLTALFATVLLDFGTLREIVRRRGVALAGPLVDGLCELHDAGYDALADGINACVVAE
jgi:hypothetical protein